ncbi:hypothetical protein HUG17_7762 [Dermatophagoides farinae]|uniref:Uncharacterized protein n=1 Tax=Dermatophagoides farinae TaxID=6954 RepID=A0A9D4NZD1_DERFA|nr:uncharacterized protein LOC124495685 [Dermatophagoides farinae]KAH7640295.1 hypothetical protein HUG17_7762 [Dermatophagoides farinae]
MPNQKMPIIGIIITVILVPAISFAQYGYERCIVPTTLRGEWFSREDGQNVVTRISENEFSDRGFCMEMVAHSYDNFTFLLKKADCLSCVRILIRTLNVMEKIETNCLQNNPNVMPNYDSMCKNSLDNNQEMITMFSTNPSGKNCRSSLEGVWNFAYQNRFKFTGECIHEEANITACQKPGTQFFNLNQQFIMNYRKCVNMRETEDAEVQYKCLGDWYVGKNHFFAVVNSRESRMEEKYRCFLSNRDDDQFLSVSITAECNTLKSPQEGPERLRLFPVRAELVQAKCTLPQNFSGIWVNTANFDAEVTINSTTMVEKWRPDTGRIKQEIFICQEQRGSRFVMARLGVNGCQKDYVCFEFLPRHHNVIRYRKGQAMIMDRFSTVCAWTMFNSEEQWKYDILIAKNPVSIECPIAGKFRFKQTGDILFETRIRGGVTQFPRPNVYCKANISDFSVCDSDQKILKIDADYCLSVDQFGLPVDIYSQPDYQMQCIAYWKENLKSYLITYDSLDAYSRYRCWVYQRADLNVILMSMSVGAFCHIRQDVRSGHAVEGAQVALEMTEYEREHDDCPLYFDDGSNPYKSAQDHVTILRPMATNSIRSFLNHHHHHHIWLQTFLFISSFLI